MSKNPMDDWDVLSKDECLRRLLMIRGQCYRQRPTKNNKSTTFRVWDVAILAKVDYCDLKKILRGKRTIGRIRIRRISRVLKQIEAGLVTKTQYGSYHFHDKPVKTAKREMRVMLGIGGVSMQKPVPARLPDTMPDFKSVFGR